MESNKRERKMKKKSKVITPNDNQKSINNTENIIEKKENTNIPVQQEVDQNKKLSVYIGSYEGNIFCVDVDLKTKELEMYKFKVSENSMKVITHKNEFIFASGIDEMIHIYDMNKKEEKGLFMTYSGSISNIIIVKDFILACGSQCEIPIWRMSDFGLLHNLKGHKKDVITMAVHKSSKFAISSAKDNTLIVWNLMNGLKIIKYNLRNLLCNKIIFFNDDSRALIVFDYEIWIFNYMKNTDENEDWIEKKVKSAFKIFDAFIKGEKVILFGVLGEVLVYESLIKNENFFTKKLDKPEKLDKEELDIRVKAIDITTSKKLALLSIIYSNHEIYIYDLIKILNNPQDESAIQDVESKEKYDKVKKFKSIIIKTGDRLTCLNSQIK